MSFIEQLDLIYFSGRSSKTRNILFLGDGFLSEQALYFDMWTEALTHCLFRIRPFDLVRGYFNVFRYFTPSKEECIGARDSDWLVTKPNDPQGRSKLFRNAVPKGYESSGQTVGLFPITDTALGLVHTGQADGKIGLEIPDSKRLKKVLNSIETSGSGPPKCWRGADEALIVVLANTDYGSSVSIKTGARDDRISLVCTGLFRTFEHSLLAQTDRVSIGGISVPKLKLSSRSVKPDDTEGEVVASILAHELGHSFFGLADEYGGTEYTEAQGKPNIVDAPKNPTTGAPTFDIDVAWKNNEHWGEHIDESVRVWMKNYDAPLYSREQAITDKDNFASTPPVAPTSGPNAAAAKAALDEIMKNVQFRNKPVGLYAGAGANLNVFRPTGRCKMRNAGLDKWSGYEFCYICMVEIVRAVAKDSGDLKRLLMEL